MGYNGLRKTSVCKIYVEEIYFFVFTNETIFSYSYCFTTFVRNIFSLNRSF